MCCFPCFLVGFIIYINLFTNSDFLKDTDFCTPCDSSIITIAHHCWPQPFLLEGSSTENFVVDTCIHIVYDASGLREEYTKQECYELFIIKTTLKNKNI